MGKYLSIIIATLLTTVSAFAQSSCEWWIDNDMASRQIGTIDNELSISPDISGIASGLHYFNFRIRQSENAWGSIYRKAFYKTDVAADAVGYEYWLDNDYANRIAGEASSEELILNVDLSSLAKYGLHYFNFRARNSDGTWGATYRKAFLPYNPDENGRILGYRHALAGKDLGYVELPAQESNVYSFEIDLPTGAGINLADVPIKFNGDELSAIQIDSISYNIQLKSDRGWMSPAGYYFLADVNFTTTAETLAIPSSSAFAKPAATEFKAFKFESKGRPLYVHTDVNAIIDIYYSDGVKQSSISAEKSTETNILKLAAGTYYCVIYNAENANVEGNVTFSIDDSILENVIIEYNGRYASMWSEEENVTIYYTLDEKSPDSYGTLYTGPIDVGGLCYINAVAKLGDDYTSGFATYKVNVYADERHVQTAEAGHLPEAFGWNEGFANEVEEYRIAGPVNGRDLEKVRSMTALKHLDVKSAVCDSIPDGAFAGMALISISLPEKMRAYGNGIFSGCDMICAITCNDASLTVDERITAGCGNPNVLVYVAEDQYTTDEADAALNIVAGATASRLRLLDARPFYAPKAFKAVDASFARFFSKQTGMDGCAGWETITVPFDVDAIADSQGEVHPFAADTGDRRFWLYSPVKNGWERAAGIKANQPYLIAMPNHPWYDYDMNITGEVTFSAENVSVAASQPQTGMVFRKLYEMTGSFMPMAAAENVYAINDEEIEGYAPGAVFAAALRDIRPFECYLSGETSAQMMPVMDRSEVDMTPANGTVGIYVENGDICIRSGIDCRIPVYDTVGNLVRIAEVKAGETCRVSGLYKGIYIVGDRKLYVK